MHGQQHIKTVLNYPRISLSSATYKISSNTLSKLTPYAEETIGYHQCGFRCNRSTNDHTFFIHSNTWEKMRIKWGSPSVITDFKKAYDSSSLASLPNR